MSKSKRDYLADLLLHIHGAGLPPPQLEERFGGIDGTKRYRWDLCWPDQMVALEYQGGTFSDDPSHGSIKGKLRDQAKLSEAAACGWRVLHVNAKTVESGEALAWIEHALWREDRA